MTLRILITGSRDWSDRRAITTALFDTGMEHYAALGEEPSTAPVVVHGGARGADTLAEAAARFLGWRTEKWPADWNRNGKAAGPIRNQQMVDAGADICLAFPLGESRGTRDCMRRAEQAGIRVVDVPEQMRVKAALDEMTTEAAQLGLYETTADPKDTR